MAMAGFRNYSEYHQYKYYESNHFKWSDLDFNNSLALDIKGRIGLPKRNISVGVQFQNLTNYVYLNEQCQPAQYEGNLQVLAVDLLAKLRAWRFHLDVQAVYQLTSNKDVLPLPDVALYGNFYYKDKFFKVLTVQIGASVRYHTDILVHSLIYIMKAYSCARNNACGYHCIFDYLIHVKEQPLCLSLRIRKLHRESLSYQRPEKA